MKINILDITGKKIKEKETELFEEPIREDIIAKVVEAEKIWQPWSPRFRAGMDSSASGQVRHKRHSWKSDRGRGLSRIPKKAFWRRGTQFSWEGAIVPSTKGGRRAHPPKGSVNDKKINKKELLKALKSALSYVINIEAVKKKYSSLEGKEIKLVLPLVVDKNVLTLNTKKFLEFLSNILGEFYNVAVQKKSVRAGIGKLRGRKYRKNSGLLLVVGNNENTKVKGIEIIKVKELVVSDLASNGARLVMFSENAVEELEGVLIKSNEIESGSRVEKNDEREKVDKRKIRREKRREMKKKGSSERDYIDERGDKERVKDAKEKNKISNLKQDKARKSKLSEKKTGQVSETTNEKQIQKVKERKNISSLTHDKIIQARNNSSQNVLTDTSIIKKKNKEANIASRVKHYYTDSFNTNHNKYINFSIHNNMAGNASVALRVKHQSNKLGLHRLPGSSPGGGATPAIFSNLNNPGAKIC